MNVLLIIAIAMTVVFLLLLLMTFLRKIKFDAIHHNFLDLEDEFGGRVVRAGFAARPRYAGTFKGIEFVISFTTEKDKEVRRYYLTVTMHSSSTYNFTVMSREWLGEANLDEKREREAQSINNRRYLVESTDSATLKLLDLPLIEGAVEVMDPFAWLLIGQNRMLLERASENIIEDTKPDALRPLIEGLYQLQTALG